MGLDNGLSLYTKDRIHMPSEINGKIWLQKNNKDYPYEYEICYWRKCWNIRAGVAKILEAPLDYVAKTGLSIEEVKGLWYLINELNDKAAWEEGDSIWHYSEIHDHLDNDLLALEWLIYFMRNHKEDEYTLEFYDSY